MRWLILVVVALTGCIDVPSRITVGLPDGGLEVRHEVRHVFVVPDLLQPPPVADDDAGR